MFLLPPAVAPASSTVTYAFPSWELFLCNGGKKLPMPTQEALQSKWAEINAKVIAIKSTLQVNIDKELTTGKRAFWIALGLTALAVAALFATQPLVSIPFAVAAAVSLFVAYRAYTAKKDLQLPFTRYHELETVILNTPQKFKVLSDNYQLRGYWKRYLLHCQLLIDAFSHARTQGVRELLERPADYGSLEGLDSLLEMLNKVDNRGRIEGFLPRFDLEVGNIQSVETDGGKWQFTMEEGVKHGPARALFKDGRTEECFYLQGVKDGPAVFKCPEMIGYTQHIREEKAMYVRGKLEGPTEINLAGVTTQGFYVNGQKQGAGSITHSDKAIERFTFRNDRIHGTSTKTTPDGKTVLTVTEYVDGVIQKSH